MRIDKYAGDYRLKNITDKNGKLKTVAYYAGDDFVFKTPLKAEKMKIKYLLLTLVFDICVVSSVFIKVSALRSPFVMLPFSANLIPAIYLADAAVRLMRAGDVLKREEKDKIYNRTAACSFVGTAFSLFGFIGAVFNLFNNKVAAADILYMLLIVLCLTAGALMFVNKKHIEIVVKNTENSL